MSSEQYQESMQPVTPGSSIHLLFGEINSDTSYECVAWLLNQNYSNDPPKMLNLIINSPGGDLNDGFAIIDVMNSIAIPVRTIGLGQIQSAGLMIFLAGAKGERVLTPSTAIMSHQYSTTTAGKHNELITIQKEFNLTHQRMINHYRKHTGLSNADIEKYLLPANDVYLSAEEALEYGICDRIALI